MVLNINLLHMPITRLRTTALEYLVSSAVLLRQKWRLCEQQTESGAATFYFILTIYIMINGTMHVWCIDRKAKSISLIESHWLF